MGNSKLGCHMAEGSMLELAAAGKAGKVEREWHVLESGREVCLFGSGERPDEIEGGNSDLWDSLDHWRRQELDERMVADAVVEEGCS